MQLPNFLNGFTGGFANSTHCTELIMKTVVSITSHLHSYLIKEEPGFIYCTDGMQSTVPGRTRFCPGVMPELHIASEHAAYKFS